MTHTLLASLLLAALSAAPFTLEDQFEGRHTERTVFAGDKPVVMIGGDARKTGEAIRDWVVPLAAKLGERARLVGLADLDAVPFFVPRSSIRGNLKELLPKTPILCDWGGDFYGKLGFPEDRLVTVRVFDASGAVLGQVDGGFNPARLEQVVALLP